MFCKCYIKKCIAEAINRAVYVLRDVRLCAVIVKSVGFMPQHFSDTIVLVFILFLRRLAIFTTVYVGWVLNFKSVLRIRFRLTAVHRFLFCFYQPSVWQFTLLKVPTSELAKFLEIEISLLQLLRTSVKCIFVSEAFRYIGRFFIKKPQFD